MSQAHIFPDTNIFLHYPTVEQIDWKAICNASSVRVVVCLTVIDELDDKKGDSRLADRAKRSIKSIRTINAQGGQVRDGVTLTVYSRQLAASDFQASAIPDNKDLHIVRLAQLYQEEHAGKRVAILTEDFGMEVRCAGAVECIPIDQQMKLPNPDDEVTKKHKQAVTELTALKSRLPILVPQLSWGDEEAGDSREVEFFLSPKADHTTSIAELMKSLHEEHPEQEALGSAAFGFESAFKTYNAKLRQFYAKCKAFYETQERQFRLKHRIFSFDLHIRNSGAGPADDVDVMIELTDELSFLAERSSSDAKIILPQEFPTPPEFPNLPDLASSLREPNFLSFLPERQDFFGSSEPSLTIIGEPGKPYSLHFHIQRVKHGHAKLLGQFIAVVARDLPEPFEAAYLVTAEQLPRETIGKLLFKLVRESVRAAGD